MSEHILSVIVASPFLAALLIMLVPGDRHGPIRVLGFVGSVISLLGAIYVALHYDQARGGMQFGVVYPFIPRFGIDIRLAADGWSVALLLLTGIIMTAGSLASATLTNRPKEFYILLLVLVAGVFGVFVCQDLFIFFLFYEIAVLPMYLLIGIWGSKGKVAAAGPFKAVWRDLDVGGKEYAAMKLTLMLLVGSAAILVGMFAIYFAAGGKSFDMIALAKTHFPRDMQLWVFPMLWLGFGSLAGVFPFHTWSPDGHAAAPTAVSMLHAGVLMKLGAFGVMRVGMIILPEGAAAWAPVVGAVAALNVIYGAVSAMSQKDLKYVIAYSSVSHMGVVMLGAATLDTDGWNGAVYQMFAHGIMTGLFFALVGLIYERAHSRWVPSMGGFAKVMPGVAAFFTLAGLSSLGMPGSAGFVAEFLVFAGAWKSGNILWAIPAMIGAWVTAVYVLRATKMIFWGDGPSHEFHDLNDAKRVEWGALWILGTCIVLFGCAPRLVLDFIGTATGEYLPAIAKAAASIAPVALEIVK
jgi:NADH-quinone oxidoreductase subunit M